VTYLRSLPRTALAGVLAAFPNTGRPLLDYHEALLRGPSALSVAERELIAAYVSALNACDYCHGIHAQVAERFGLPAAVVESLVIDLDGADVDVRLRPLLRLVRTVTMTPGRVVPADVDAAYAAGWDDEAVYTAVSICALFNAMNRIVSGLGINAGEDYRTRSATRLADRGYAGLLPPP